MTTTTQLNNFINSINLAEDMTISIVDGQSVPQVARLKKGSEVISQITSVNQAFMQTIMQWAIEHAAGYLPQHKSHADDYYDLVSNTLENFNSRIQEEELTEDDDWQDVLHEVVDAAVPHYYSEIYRVAAADGIATEFDDSSYCPDTKDVTKILQARIYEALYNDVANDTGVEWYDDSEDEQDDE